MSPSPSAPDAESPNSPTTTAPSPPPAPPATSGLFLPPKGPAAPLPPPSPSSSTSDPSPKSAFDDVAGPSWSADFAGSEATSPSRDESSDTPSTGSLTVSRAGLRAAIGQGLRTVTRVVSRIAARSPEEQQFGVWKADHEDVEAISTPAARVIWRRLPEEARSSDTVDLVVLALAVIGYVAKNVDLKWELAKARAQGQLVDIDQHVGVFVPSGDAAADAAAAQAWGVPGYPAPAP